MTWERSATKYLNAWVIGLATIVAGPSAAGAGDGLVETMRKAAEAPAMQGHDAEARMRDPEAEARWRRLFFDDAGREEGEAQVSCDHRIARRPDVDGGAAAVAIAQHPESGRVLARRWETSEGSAIDLDGVKGRLAAAAPSGSVVDGIAFRRCR